MMEDKRARTDIDAALASVLIVFCAAMAIPMADAVLTIVDSVQSGSFLSDPNLAMVEMFLLAIFATFMAFVVETAYGLVRGDRRWGARHEPPEGMAGFAIERSIWSGGGPAQI